MRKSFRLKVASAFLIGIMGCMILMSLMSEMLLRSLFINDSKKSMQSYAKKVARALNRESDNIEELLQTINNEYLIRTTILTEDMEAYFSEYGESIKSPTVNLKRAKKWVKVYLKNRVEGEPYFKEFYDKNDKIRRLIYVRKTKSNYYIVMNKPIKGIDQDVHLVSRFILMMGISIAVVITILWSFLTRPFVSQMEKMSRITKKMSELNFEERVSYKSSDEIGILAESINEMSESLKESIEHLQKDVERRKIMVRNISHELKTPITTIKGYAENTQIILPENAKVQHYCEIMIEECDSIDRLVNALLMMSRLESDEIVYEKSPIHTKALAEVLCKRAAIAFPQARIVADCEEQTVLANTYLLESALFNYIDNAVKYGKADTDIRLKGYANEDRFFFSVINEGAAIAEEDKAAIWDVFYKTDKSRKRNKGYGIGLSIVRQTARLHEGGVDVRCEDGKTEFIFWIPLCKKQ